MKTKITFLSIVFTVIISFGAVAQYNCYPFKNIGINPGNLNNDVEDIYPTAATGWTQVMATSATPAWSANQTIPFSFTFNGTAYTSYKVSSTGVLTFTTTATNVPAVANEALPSANIPDNSICAWGIELTGSNDKIWYKTFGTAPNRQYWIHFNSASSADIQNGFTYWSIVLEETTNNVYVVDQRTYCRDASSNPCSGNVSLTVGVQINSSTAVQATGSPNIASGTTNGGSVTDVTDNSYYIFTSSVYPDWDIVMTSLTLPKLSKVNTALPITGTILNAGKSNITSFRLNYSVNGGATVQKTITTSVVSGGKYSYTADPYTPATPGMYYNIKVWTDNINGSNNDENPANDTLSAKIFVNQGISAVKRVLIEEYTTVPCGYCPDGHIVLNGILSAYPNVIGVCHHAGFGTDGMTIGAHNTLAADMADGAPTATIDRVKYPEDASNPAISRNLWETKAVERLAEAAPCAVQIYGTYNQSTRQLDATFKADFVDNALPGDLRMTLMLVEDHVTGTGTSFDQTNYYYATAGHPMYQVGVPYSASSSHIPGYDHRYVSRAFLSPTWGTSGVIPQTPVVGQSYTKAYNTTLDANWNADSVFLIGVVSYYNTDKALRSVLNSCKVYIKQMPSSPVSINEKTEYNSINVYPNPVNEIAQINFSLDKTSQVFLVVFNSLGQKVLSTENQRYSAGTQTLYFNTGSLEKGVYIGIMSVDGKNFTAKFVK
jgi:hypothetical protein